MSRTSPSRKKAAPRAKAAAVPLAVDFDGTLQLSDMNWEGFVWLLKRRPWACVMMIWLLATQGRGVMKMAMQEWAERWHWVPRVPLDGRVVKLMEVAKAEGREVVVVTGSAERLVAATMQKMHLDYPVIGTTGETNLVRDAKASAMVARWGEGGFDYIGNSSDDLRVWPHARHAIVANARRQVVALAMESSYVVEVLPRQVSQGKALMKALRPHQWLKNLLVFVPLVTAHQWGSVMAWSMSALAFIGFCLCASGIYLINDLLDVQDDRIHVSKRKRPFAAGTLPLSEGLVLAPLFLLAGLTLGLLVSLKLALLFLGYVLLTSSYSWWLKHKPLADVVTLAGLYGVRMIGGVVATGIPLSYWLGLFAFLIFYSLALLKRYVELRAMVVHHPERTHARGYHVNDAMMLAMQGLGSGMLSVLVVGLYIDSPDVTVLYQHPVWLGVICPLLMLQIARMWLLAHRGKMHDDPIVFAAKDPLTWLVGLAALAVMVGAA